MSIEYDLRITWGSVMFAIIAWGSGSDADCWIIYVLIIVWVFVACLKIIQIWLSFDYLRFLVLLAKNRRCAPIFASSCGVLARFAFLWSHFTWPNADMHGHPPGMAYYCKSSSLVHFFMHSQPPGMAYYCQSSSLVYLYSDMHGNLQGWHTITNQATSRNHRQHTLWF